MRLVDANALMRCIPAEEMASRIAVANAPTIEERKKGKWLRKLSQTPWPICSECGIYGANESNYCPNCGADMRGGDDGA